jgi:hypothetical protein
MVGAETELVGKSDRTPTHAIVAVGGEEVNRYRELSHAGAACRSAA